MVTPPIVLHGNARAHTAGVVSALLNRWGWEVLYHPPPYSPNISPCDYDLIPKMPMRGKSYCTIEDVKQAAERSLRTINRLGSANGIQRLRVAGNTLYTTVGTTSRAYETWNHLGELFIQL